MTKFSDAPVAADLSAADLLLVVQNDDDVFRKGRLSDIIAAAANVPVMVQRASARKTNGVTVSLPAAPTVGNLLIFIAAGEGTDSSPDYGMPPGVACICKDRNTATRFQQVSVGVRRVVAGDGDDWTFTAGSKINASVIEVSGGHAVSAYVGVPSIPSADVAQTGVYPLAAGALTFLMVETDGTCTVTAEDSPLTLLQMFDNNLPNNTPGDNHYAALFSCENATAATPKLPMTAPSAIRSRCLSLSCRP